jgi:hypothetical protein
MLCVSQCLVGSSKAPDSQWAGNLMEGVSGTRNQSPRTQRMVATGTMEETEVLLNTG